MVKQAVLQICTSQSTQLKCTVILCMAKGGRACETAGRARAKHKSQDCRRRGSGELLGAHHTLKCNEVVCMLASPGWNQRRPARPTVTNMPSCSHTTHGVWRVGDSVYFLTDAETYYVLYMLGTCAGLPRRSPVNRADGVKIMFFECLSVVCFW